MALPLLYFNVSFVENLLSIFTFFACVSCYCYLLRRANAQRQASL